MGDFSHLLSCLHRRVAWRGGSVRGHVFTKCRERGGLMDPTDRIVLYWPSVPQGEGVDCIGFQGVLSQSRALGVA